MPFRSRGGEIKVKLVLPAARQTGQKCCAAVNVKRWLRLARRQAYSISRKANPGV
ncbi:hypothetical protein [Desulfotomaculum copahuensis]|uniref:hypothetical protein n=1 Tax=Desulfotomaculum copahuensis TaxID=1838280 RepID=UPI000A8ADE2A|nr:hypothetical protein [Desulfotomaculum copahuensis]